MKIAVVGGDVRQCYAALELEKSGINTELWGIKTDLKSCADSMQETVRDAGAVLLPMPVTRGDGILNAPLADEKIKLGSLLDAVSGESLILVGKADSVFLSECEKRGLKFVDYSECEAIAVSGAISTAEAAVCELIRYTGASVHKSKILVTGAGKIGCRLVRLLDSMGAEVTVSARKDTDIFRLRSMGYHAEYLQELGSFCGLFDAVINTVPAEIINFTDAGRLRENCVVIDLASGKGGVSEKAAGFLGERLVHATGLPGKYEPKTAGIAVAEAVMDILKERNCL